MKRFNKWGWITLFILLCVACNDSDKDFEWDINDNNPMDGGSAGTGSAGSDSSGNLFDFSISWDDVSDTDFVDAPDIVITDSSDDEYEDFVENATFDSQIEIVYSEDAATVTGEVSGVTVSQNGAYVTIDSTVSGVEYILSGTTSSGSLKVYSSKKFKLTLNGVDLTSTQGAAINIQSGKRAYVEVKSGTSNILTDAATYTDTVDGEDQKACFFSEGKLLFNGKGSLTVNGNNKHGICSDDYVRLRSGSNITVASAVKDGIHANDRIIMGGGLLKLITSGEGLDCEKGDIDIRGGLLKVNTTGTASKGIKAETDITISGGTLILLTSGEAEYDSDDDDISSAAGIKCDGNLTISDASVSAKSTGSAGKGINCQGELTITESTVKIITTGKKYIYGSLDSSPKGIKATGNLTINSGTIYVSTTGGTGSEGIESKDTLTIHSGTVNVYAYDDCLNAASHIAINGGYIYCYSSGNDGIDSNGTLTITGGTIVSSGTTSPEGGIDCDQSNFRITGGTILGIGGDNSTPTASSCTQHSLIYAGSGSNGTLITITTSEGTHVMSYQIPRNYSTMNLLFSSDKLQSGTSYVIYTGGEVSGNTFYGMTTDGSFTNGTQASTFTINTMVTTVGNLSDNGPGAPGGGGGWR